MKQVRWTPATPRLNDATMGELFVIVFIWSSYAKHRYLGNNWKKNISVAEVTPWLRFNPIQQKTDLIDPA